MDADATVAVFASKVDGGTVGVRWISTLKWMIFLLTTTHHKKDSTKISCSSLEMSIRRRFKYIPNDRKVYVFYSNSCFSTSSSINCLQVRWSFSGWWFQILFIFTPIWRRFPFWLILFKGVGSTTNWFWFGTGKWIRESTTVLRFVIPFHNSMTWMVSYGQLLAAIYPEFLFIFFSEGPCSWGCNFYGTHEVKTR